MSKDRARMNELLNKRDITEAERKERDALIVKILQVDARRLRGGVS